MPTSSVQIASRARWPATLVLAALLVAPVACRRSRFPPRGDAAAVIVVKPRRDAAPPPRRAEAEPNDTVEDAQPLDLEPGAPPLVVEGSLSLAPDGKVKDVDQFKLAVAGSDTTTPAPPVTVDAGPPEDPRLQARRLSVELAAHGTVGLKLELVDDAGKVVASVSAEPGQSAGMPNLAVPSGRPYCLRVRGNPKAAKRASPEPVDAAYLLTAQLGDFDVADEREPNDTPALANAIAVAGGAEWSGYHGWWRDQDVFRIPLPEVLSAMDVDLDAVEGVGASLLVQDGAGARLASARGRRNERLALRNVLLRPAAPDAGPASRSVFLLVRADSGSNRAQRFVARVSLGAPRADVEVEPNDTPGTASPLREGSVTAYLSPGDVDHFRYDEAGQREATFVVTFPARVRGRIAAFRPGALEPVATAEAKKPRQSVSLPALPTLGQPLVLRVSQRKADGNANDPYTLTVASRLVQPPAVAPVPPPPAPAP